MERLEAASSSPRRKLPVYERQLFPESVLGASARRFETAGTTLQRRRRRSASGRWTDETC